MTYYDTIYEFVQKKLWAEVEGFPKVQCQVRAVGPPTTFLWTALTGKSGWSTA